MSLTYSISNEVFARFPEYLRGVVIARGIQNGPSSDALIASLREAEGALSASLAPENIAAHPRIAPWREAYRSLGVKPADFRPSMEALVRRVVKKDPLPAISRVVDLGNLVSIQTLVPIGAHAIDVLRGSIELRPAAGDETFEPFGSEAIEHPLPGEFIFVEGKTVLTRRWTWRQAKHTLVVPETTAVEINVDALPPVTANEVRKICELLGAQVQQHCGGKVHFGILSRENPALLLD